MLKYAKIIDETTKEVKVGVGCSDDYYKEIGMTEMNVEQSYNGKWYVLGYAPVKPEPTPEERKQARIIELKMKLLETDYIHDIILEGDATTEDYAEVIANRKSWRAEVRQLLGQ